MTLLSPEREQTKFLLGGSSLYILLIVSSTLSRCILIISFATPPIKTDGVFKLYPWKIFKNNKVIY